MLTNAVNVKDEEFRKSNVFVQVD